MRTAAALLFGLSLLCQSTAALADEPLAGPETAITLAASAASSAVSGASNSPSPAVGENANSIAANGDPYVGMTRASERGKIEGINPTGWLARFGNVETTTPR